MLCIDRQLRSRLPCVVSLTHGSNLDVLEPANGKDPTVRPALLLSNALLHRRQCLARTGT